MRFAAVLLVTVLIALADTAFAQSTRKVAGIELQYGFDFREDREFSRRAFEAAKTANPRTRSVQVFEAPTLMTMSGGSGSFHIVKTVYERRCTKRHNTRLSKNCSREPPSSLLVQTSS